METGDPDDVITLLLLASHPGVDLKAVTITPGSREQVSLVRWLLNSVGLLDSVRVGANSWPADAEKKGCVNGKFYDNFERLKTSDSDCEPAAKVLVETCNEATTLVTGAPLKNLGAAIATQRFSLGRWVAQGGFAGEGVVPREQQLDKFRGKTTCPTWNFGGDRDSAVAALSCPSIRRRVLVSKNVCHDDRAAYSQTLHDRIAMERDEAANMSNVDSFSLRRAAALKLLHHAMEADLARRPSGKKLHDPLALAVALDENVATLAEVQMFQNKNEWGARLMPESETWIAIAFDQDLFHSSLLGCSGVERRSPNATGRSLPSIAGYTAPNASSDADEKELKPKRRWKK
jgi:pyrimidine-specific ribonucleoside hydrolase